MWTCTPPGTQRAVRPRPLLPAMDLTAGREVLAVPPSAVGYVLRPDRCGGSYGAAAAFGTADALTLCSGGGGFLVSSSVVEDKQAAAGDAVADGRDVWGGEDTGGGVFHGRAIGARTR